MRSNGVHQKTYSLFASAGIIAGLLQYPFFAGIKLNVPDLAYSFAPGFIFALLMTSVAMFLRRVAGLPLLPLRYALGALVLTVGMLGAIFPAFPTLSLALRILPSDKFHVGGIAIAFFLGEIVACVVWSLVLSAWVRLINGSGWLSAFRIALVVTLSIAVLVNLSSIVYAYIRHGTGELTWIFFVEIIGSALVLARFHGMSDVGLSS